MGLFQKLCIQTRKPEGFWGKLMAKGMNMGHAALADWGMSFLPKTDAEKIADLGCGGGRNASELLKRYPGSHVTALDYSPVSVKETEKKNRKAVRDGRCTAVQGNVAHLPFPEGTFDLATAFETIYFWPGLEKCFAEVYQVLRPGGTFLVCNESDGTDEMTLRYARIIPGMAYYTQAEIRDALYAAGFSNVQAEHHKSMPWITVTAEK